MWFAAHVIMYFRFTDGNQDRFPVWENVFLVQAPSPEEAHARAVRMGQGEEGDSGGSLRYDGRPARPTTERRPHAREMVNEYAGVGSPRQT